jgi:hypothetical protein
LVALGQAIYIPGTGIPPGGVSTEFRATQLSVRLTRTFQF